MHDLFDLLKKMGIRRKYLFLLLLRSPFDACRARMLAGLMKTTFLCLESGDTNRLLTQSLIYGLLCALLFLYNGTIWSIYAAFVARAEALLHKMLLQRILSLSFRQITDSSGGTWLTKLNSDIQAAGMMMGGPLNVPHAAAAMINTAISSFLLIRSSLLLSIVAWGFILPYLLLHYRLVLKHMPPLKETSLNAISENTSAIKPLITEADAILLYDAGNLLLKQCEKSSLELLKTNMRMHMRSALGDAIVRLFGISGYLVLLVLGYRMIRVGTISFPDLIYCFQIRGSVLAGISMMLICFNNIKTNQVCVKRIHDTLSM